MENSSHIVIHQAYGGFVGHGHGLICSTLHDAALDNFLSPFTDRPGPIPAGVMLQPYLSGASSGQFYIITRTFGDLSAPRGGIVFTHALILELDAMIRINNLDLLFSLLVDKIPADRGNLLPLRIPAPPSVEMPSVADIPQYVHDAAAALGTGKLPILFCGNADSFRNAITTLWAGLPPALRKIFSFSAGFTTQNTTDPRTLIYFQPALQQQLVAFQLVLDEPAIIPGTPNAISSFLLGGERTNGFGLFARQLELQLVNWQILSSAIKAYELYRLLDAGISADQLRQLFRLSALLNPQPQSGKGLKQRLVNRMIANIVSGEDANLLALRNLPLAAFEKGEETFGVTIRQRMHSCLGVGHDFSPSAMAQLTSGLVITDTTSWWQQAVVQALSTDGALTDPDTISRFWQVLVMPAAVPALWLAFIPDDRAYEQLYIKALPATIDKDLAGRLAAAMRPKKWLLLHANLLMHTMTIPSAAIEQLALETMIGPSNLDGTAFLCLQLPNNDLLTLALSEPHDIFRQQFAARVADNAALLQRLDVTITPWRQIWSISLEKTKNLSWGISVPRVVVDQILDLVIDGKQVSDNILSLISTSSYADVSQYGQRILLWQKLPAKYKLQFVQATATAMIQSLLDGANPGFTDDQTILAAVTADDYVTRLLNTYRAEINKVLLLFEAITPLKDRFLADYIRLFRGPLSAGESDRLGLLIQRLAFPESADAVFARAKTETAFHQAFGHCRDLVSPSVWDKLMYSRLLGKQTDASTIYDGLLSIAVELYPTGPEDRNIFKRSGGDTGKLFNYWNREENWRHAIQLLRNGGGGKKLSLSSLLEEMRNDYPANEELKQFQNLIKST